MEGVGSRFISAGEVSNQESGAEVRGHSSNLTSKLGYSKAGAVEPVRGGYRLRIHLRRSDDRR